jgi:ABC-2 type transport system permease protein
MDMWRRIWAITQKEFIQLIRHPQMLLAFLIGAPLEIILFAVAIHTDAQHIPMVVADQSLSAASQAYIQAYTNSASFDIVSSAASQSELVAAIDSGQASIGLIIPPDFAGKAALGQASVLLLVDGSSSFTSQAAYRSAQAVSQQYAVSLTRQTAPPLDAHVSILYNPDMKDLLFIVPGMIGFIMYGVSLKLTSFSIVREREIGTIEAILVTPIRPIEFLIAKLIPNLLVAFFNTAASLTVTILIFQIPFRGSLPLYLALASVFALAGLGLALTISSLSQTQMQANQVATLFNLVAIFLSGFMFPANALPPVLRALSFLQPLTYFTPISNGIFVKGTGLEALWPQVLALLAMIVVILFIGARAFRQRLD